MRTFANVLLIQNRFVCVAVVCAVVSVYQSFYTLEQSSV